MDSILLRPLRSAALLALLAALFHLASPVGPEASAQGLPNTGEWFTDTDRLGFRVRAPRDWRFVPPPMDDPFLMARYVPNGRDWVPLRGQSQLTLWGWTLRFELEELEKSMGLMARAFLRRDLPRGASSESVAPPAPLTLDEWLLIWLARERIQGDGWRVVESGARRQGSRTVEERILEGSFQNRDGEHLVRIFVSLLEIEAGRYAAVAYNGPGERTAWRRYEQAFRRMGRTLQPIDVTEEEELGPDSDPRAERRRQLEAEAARLPGWWLHESHNYFILTDSRDRRFIEELAERLEAIRKVFEEDYPAEKARRWYESDRARAGAGGAAAASAEDEDGEDEEEDRGTEASVDALALSRTSVVRVCSDRDMYTRYGGPPGSAGYWSSYHRELVVFDDRQSGGRNNTWAVVNHEAFHQYIYYFYGNIAPHSWYNEGTGDFYSGMQYRRGRFTLQPFDWRRGLARDNIRAGRYVPLSEFVRWNQRQYYGTNSYELSGGDNYAQGWSLIWFLRQGAGRPRHWNPRWETILDTYLGTLAETGDLNKAVDAAFEGVDWEELERAWKAYIR